LELMQHRASTTRSWRMQDCDAHRRPLFELLFATLGNAHLPGDFRRTFIGVSSNFASLYDTITDLRATLRKIDRIMLRADRTLRLAASNGRRIDDVETPKG
jgi:hypothetical protein